MNNIAIKILLKKPTTGFGSLIDQYYHEATKGAIQHMIDNDRRPSLGPGVYANELLRLGHITQSLYDSIEPALINRLQPYYIEFYDY